MYMYLNARIFPTTGYARVLLFMFIRRELGETRTGCLFQFTYCVIFNKILSFSYISAKFESTDQFHKDTEFPYRRQIDEKILPLSTDQF